MLIFPDKRLTYLATPKTGSTAIEMALRHKAEITFAKRRKHINARRFTAKVAPFLAQTFGIETETVAVMRAPVAQIKSWYRYRARPQIEGGPRSTSGISFDSFVLALASDTPPEFAQIGSQFRFLTDGQGNVAVDHLFAYEDQPALIAFLSERLGVVIEPQEKNVSPRIPAPLSPTTERTLRKARQDEFELYDRLMAAGGYLRRL